MAGLVPAIPMREAPCSPKRDARDKPGHDVESSAQGHGCVQRRSPYVRWRFRRSALSGVAVIESPCNKVCTLDPVSGLCIGCGRSLDEIARWAQMSDAERARVMAELGARMQKRPTAVI